MQFCPTGFSRRSLGGQRWEKCHCRSNQMVYAFITEFFSSFLHAGMLTSRNPTVCGIEPVPKRDAHCRRA